MIFGSEMGNFYDLIPGKEDGWLHNIAENALEFAFFVVFAVVIVFLFSRFRSFLIVPEVISWVWVFLRLIIYAVIIAIVLGVVIGWGWWIFVESGHNPDSLQYGMASYSMAVFYSFFLTPVCTVVMVWLSARKKSISTAQHKL
ncbi:hypothetical protein [Desulfomarina profundi]|uniref:hypothetical protein n=1 Tax=Desulfomarina profundi TaxID=2772557 RepID=UPI001E54CA7D|nr:hypothetical protein [Desulfomarina profundi]